MNVAIVHELLTMKGGAENVAKIFADMFPDAPIYTLLYDEKKLGDWFLGDRVRTSLVKPTFGYNHHWYLNAFPKAVEAWNFSEFDLVISSSSAFVHGIITNGKPKHLAYIHSPARYLWDRTHDVTAKMNPLLRPLFQRAAHKLRIWDTEAAYRPDTLIAASKEVQRRIELYWRQESSIIYPPIDDIWFKQSESPNLKPREYFFIASTLARYKRIDIAIDAANALGVPLKIAGTGREMNRLKRRAKPNVEFLGFKSQEDLKKIFAGAIATIIPGEEDFGLVAIESLACGTPVIAYKKGGVTETIIAGKNGQLFDDPNAESLHKVMNNFDQKKYSVDQLQDSIHQYKRKEFEKNIHDAIAAIQ